VRFCRVPAHSGVERNEIEDQLAKRALKLDIIDINVPLGIGEARRKITAILIDVCQKR
jgi:ribonuclease HI